MYIDKKKLERYNKIRYNGISLYEAAEALVSFLGDLQDDNFKDTPYRILKYLEEIGRGYDPTYIEEQLSRTFPSEYDEIVSVTNIDARSLCPHHFLPVIYKIDFAYLPDKKVLGLSKIIRIIRNLSLRPVLQEDLGEDIIDTFATLKPKGIMVVLRGVHTCMYGRGVKNRGVAVTSKVYGSFKDPSMKEEVMRLFKIARDNPLDE